MRTFQNKLAMITITMIVIICHVNVSAQYGSTVREDRIWNYQIIRLIGGPDKNIHSGYHFEGIKRVNEKDYAIFRDADNKEMAYMREEDGKIFLYVGEDMQTSVKEELRNPDSRDVHGEFLLYDFSAHENQKYNSVGFSYSDWDLGYLIECAVTSVSKVENSGFDYICQDIEYHTNYSQQFQVIEGIGASAGALPFPQLIADTP